ncbi:MAG: tetratricopeptide repeat protein [Chthoniobacterales bacterium]
MTEFLQRLKERKLVQWAVAYVAAAFALLQGIDIVAQRFAWPDSIERILIIASCIGFFFVLVLAWYHGERGAQRVTGTELLILALLLAIGGGFLWRFASISREPAAAPTAAAPSANVAATPASSPPPVAIPAKSIAVLPFENLSAEKENAYFVEGIQDEILTRLAKISALKVISRTSTMRYASRPDNLREIGRELGVATILEGSVQRVADTVRVNLQLIDASSDSHLWAETYDREIKNIFSVESEVAQKVADALKATLLPAESARVASVPTKNPAAYDLFLQGQYLFNQLQISSAKDPVAAGQAARDFYRRAIAADPDFALAYARLSYLESYLHWYGVDTSSAVVDDARANADRALALQPDLPEAHLALGYVHYWCHRDYPAALSEFGIARASLPNDAEVLAAIGYVHRRQGVASRGIPEMQQASLLDPRDSTLLREIANSYTALRNYTEADTYYARSLALVPDDMEAVAQRATSTIFSGDLASAERILEAVPADTDPQGSISLIRFKLAMILRQPDKALAAIAHSPDWLMTRWEHSVVPISLLRGQALAMKGEAEPARAAFLEAENQLQPLLDQPTRMADANSYLGLVYAGLGQKEAALKAGRTAVEILPMSRDVIVGAFHLERLARTEAQVGEVGPAIEHLEQLMSAAGGETVSIATLRIDPVWDPLRKDPRFQKLLADGEAATNP